MSFLVRIRRLIASRRRVLKPGEWGEQAAARHLRGKGYRILGNRIRVGRRGELDLVARDAQTLVFVEVRTRGTERYGPPSATIRRRKRRAVCAAAVAYLKKLRVAPRDLRFDVVEVVGSEEQPRQARLRHIENAFPLDKRYQLPG